MVHLLFKDNFQSCVNSLLEATRLKKEQEALLIKQWELEKMEEERKKAEERKKKHEIG